MSIATFTRPSDPCQDVQTASQTQNGTGAWELVPIDREVLQWFQAEGYGWQDRINDVLRTTIGLSKPGPQDEGLRPDQLTSENDG